MEKIVCTYEVLPRAECRNPKGDVQARILSRLEKGNYVQPLNKLAFGKTFNAERDAMEKLVLHRHVIKTTFEHAKLLVLGKYTSHIVGYPEKHMVLVDVRIWIGKATVENLKERIESVDCVISFMEQKYTFKETVDEQGRPYGMVPVHPELWSPILKFD